MNSSAAPLIGRLRERSTIAYRQGVAVSAAEFVAEARALASCLPPGAHMLNACTDRYRFAVGFCAAVIAGKINVLPPTQAPEVISDLRSFAANVFYLTDEVHCEIDLPRFDYPHNVKRNIVIGDCPFIDEDSVAAIVFTSGSTGTPLPHRKRWGDLVCSARAAAQRLSLELGPAHAIVATVPPQHMYGLESSVMLALQGTAALVSAHPFFPADICAALESVPAPRALVTTPVHLRALLGAGLVLPPLGLIVSATAPLTAELAARAEGTFRAPLVEIYGSTETGQMATRRTTHEEPWTLFPGVQLAFQETTVFANGGHIAARTPLNDLVSPCGHDKFTLRGRNSDLINVAGKRSSFSYLNAQLQAIDGVIDGAFFPSIDAPDEPVGRLSALVVAPGRSAAEVIKELRRRIDPVFLPRPLLLTDRLPRNETGKLPRQAIEACVRALLEITAGSTATARTRH